MISPLTSHRIEKLCQSYEISYDTRITHCTVPNISTFSMAMPLHYRS